MIREQNILAANEIIELFCELIVSRLAIITKQKYVHMSVSTYVFYLKLNLNFLLFVFFIIGNALWISRKALLV